MPRFPSAQGRLNHEPDSTLAVTKTCPKDGVHLYPGTPSSPGTRHHREIQIPLQWSGSQIVVDFNKGSFEDGDPVYLYVIDSSGGVSAGFPLTISGAPPSAPSAPKNLRVIVP